MDSRSELDQANKAFLEKINNDPVRLFKTCYVKAGKPLRFSFMKLDICMAHIDEYIGKCPEKMKSEIAKGYLGGCITKKIPFINYESLAVAMLSWKPFWNKDIIRSLPANFVVTIMNALCIMDQVCGRDYDMHFAITIYAAASIGHPELLEYLHDLCKLYNYTGVTFSDKYIDDDIMDTVRVHASIYKHLSMVCHECPTYEDSYKMSSIFREEVDKLGGNMTKACRG